MNESMQAAQSQPGSIILTRIVSLQHRLCEAGHKSDSDLSLTQ